MLKTLHHKLPDIKSYKIVFVYVCINLNSIVHILYIMSRTTYTPYLAVYRSSELILIEVLRYIIEICTNISYIMYEYMIKIIT